MTLKTIDDFRVRPCGIEYLTLYLSCSSLLITLSAASVGQLDTSWGITNALFIGFSAAFLCMCRTKRQTRATQFYTEWLRSLSHTEFTELTHRLKPNSKELRLVMNLHSKQTTKHATLA